jgi:two-component system response regulator HydG
MVKERTFRTDLYYRLNVVNLEIPPLRRRKADILPLAEYFLANQAAFYGEPPKVISPIAKKLLTNYAWPGNVRELANAIERAYILTPGRQIQPVALPFEIIIADSPSYPEHELPTLDEVKRRIITQTLEFTKGRKLAAARILGVERRRLNRLIDKLNIPLSQIKGVPQTRKSAFGGPKKNAGS